MDEWKGVMYNNTSKTGRAVAIDAVIADLEEKGIEYEVFDFVMDVADTPEEGLPEQGGI